MKILKSAILVSIILFLSGCDIKNPVDNLEVRLNSIQRETLVSAYVLDARTGQPIEQEVNAAFLGINSAQVVDETNDPVSNFKAKDGFFNFGIRDGASFNLINPITILLKLECPGYVTAQYPVTFTSKGVLAYSFFMAKQGDFQESMINSNVSSGNANSSGIVNDNVSVTSNEGITVVIPSGTSLQTSDGKPLSGQLHSNISTIFFNSQTHGLIPAGLGLNNGHAIMPFMGFNATIADNSNHSAGTISNNIKYVIPLPADARNPVTGASLQPGQQLSTWNLTTSGTYQPGAPATVVQQASAPAKLFSIYASSGQGLEVSGDPDLIGEDVQTCDFTFNISNPQEGYTLQIFKDNILVYTGTSIPASITLTRNQTDPANTYHFKYGANSIDGSGGTEYASYTSPAGCGSGSATVTFNYPAAIQAIINVRGECSSRKPPIVVTPSVTFNYREVGGTWQQGTVSAGQAVISGLKINTTYEGKATYRDKEGRALIKVISPTDFQVTSQGAYNAEVTGTTSYNGQTVVEIQIVVDLKNDCD